MMGANAAVYLSFLLSAAGGDAEGGAAQTIVVTGSSEPDRGSIETRHGLQPLDIDALQAGSADQILVRLPSVFVPTNSRGEAIAFVRNAGERQVAIFYEGAALNVPWDNRLDLSLVPAGLVGSVRSASGPLAPHYGVNALAAVSLSPRRETHVSGSVGSGENVEAQSAVAAGPLVLGGSFASRGGDTLSDDATVPFSQVQDRLRTNTDRELWSVFGRLGGTIAGHELSLTAFHVGGEKGIAPEGNRATGARFWRYPDVRHSLITASASGRLGEDTTLESALWYQRFGQTIDSYASAAYDTVSARQIDRDESWGFRELIEHRAGGAVWTASLNLLDSTHRQRDIAFANGRPPDPLPAALRYRQRNWSVGAEVRYDIVAGLSGDLGLGLDTVNYLRTGDKPAVRDVSAWTARGGLTYALSNDWLVRAAAGRKVRAPTLRERFGEAINRFLVNPDLKPERIISWELGAEWRGRDAGAFLIPFAQDVDDTIDQRTVGRLRQRINLPGSTVRGIELGGTWRPMSRLSVSGDATWSRVRRKQAPSGQLNRLAEKPAVLARVRVDYRNPAGFRGGAEIAHVGSAYSADPDGRLVPLERSTSINLHVGHAVTVAGHPWEVFGLIDNATDTFIEPQLGLPAPGRTFRVGLRYGGMPASR